MFDTSKRDAAIRERRAREEQERRRILAVTIQALRDSAEKHALQEAYVVGSLTREGLWHARSDVDVAVSGGWVLEVMKDIEDATDRTVDVIDLDRHPDPDGFRRKGVKAHG